MSTWDRTNLEKHYKKHPAGECRSCWSSLVGGASPISLKEYDLESRAVEVTASLSFSAQYRKDMKVAPERMRYFIDGRLILTAVTPLSKTIATSYRHHRYRGDHSIGTGVADWLQLIDRLVEKRSSPVGKMDAYMSVIPKFNCDRDSDKALLRKAAQSLTSARRR